MFHPNRGKLKFIGKAWFDDSCSPKVTFNKYSLKTFIAEIIADVCVANVACLDLLYISTVQYLDHPQSLISAVFRMLFLKFFHESFMRAVLYP